MANMIPSSLPQNATVGEKKVFALLEKLPEDYLVYYEPRINRRMPDFVVIAPDLGIMIIEVKGWYLGNLLEMNPQEITHKQYGHPKTDKHPLTQARNYMWRLEGECQQSLDIGQLLQKGGKYSNKFIFPFGHIAVLTQIALDKAKGKFPDFDRVFPPEIVITADDLDQWEKWNGTQLSQALSRRFDPTWPFPRLDKTQVDILRMIIHPEIRINPPVHKIIEESSSSHPITAYDLKILDADQERYARSIGEGHRIIFGVAGSGKTAILISRARFLAGQDPKRNILLLCYNFALSAYLKFTLKEHSNIRVTHFDAWAIINGVTRNKLTSENSEQMGKRFLGKLRSRQGDYRFFDSILVDEAQDFEPVWFECAREALKDPDNGDLIIVGDGAQGLYKTKKINWSAIGIKAAGRTISSRFRLNRNYRNSTEIVRLAAQFALAEEINEDEGVQAIKVDPANSVRTTGFMPVLYDSFQSRADETAEIVKIVRNLLRGEWDGQKINKPLRPENIALLYRKCSDTFVPPDGSAKPDIGHMKDLIQSLTEVCPVKWISNKHDYTLRGQVCSDGLKIQTIHSAKGLQYRAVIVIWADQMPFLKYDGLSEEDENRLFYVALTRPEDFLTITYTGKSPLTETLEKMK